MVYGKTFELDDQMDIVINELKNISLVEDSEKVQQDLKVLYRTHLGDDIFAPEFGFDFATVTEIDTEKVKKRELEETAFKYIYTKDVLSIVVEQYSENKVWKEKWSVSILLLSDEEVKTLIVLE